MPTLVLRPKPSGNSQICASGFYRVRHTPKRQNHMCLSLCSQLLNVIASRIKTYGFHEWFPLNTQTRISFFYNKTIAILEGCENEGKTSGKIQYH